VELVLRDNTKVRVLIEATPLSLETEEETKNIKLINRDNDIQDYWLDT
jgi:hypothetical protein